MIIARQSGQQYIATSNQKI